MSSCDPHARRAEVFKALGHPARARMVDALTGGEQCVCELHELVGGDLSTCSKHLAVLRQAGIVEVERRGQNLFYRLRCPCFLELFRCVDFLCAAPVALGRAA